MLLFTGEHLHKGFFFSLKKEKRVFPVINVEIHG